LCCPAPRPRFADIPKRLWREACPNDRRARYAVLTPAGRALMKRIFPGHAEVIAGALAGLSRDERRIATRLLRDLGRRAAESAAPGTV